MNAMHDGNVGASCFERHQCLRRTLSALLFATCWIGASSATNALAAASNAVVLQWNEIAVQTIGDTPPFPATRAMATVQVAVFEAVDAITRRYQPYLTLISAAPDASGEAAAIIAAHDTLVWLFPGQQSFLDGKQAESLADIAAGSEKEQGIAVGRAAAAAIIADRTNDGAQLQLFFTQTSAAP